MIRPEQRPAPAAASIRQRPARGSPDAHDELVALRARLDEAEAALRAARPYRAFVESMREGAVTLADDGIILYSNTRFADMVATPLERVIGAAFRDFVAADQRMALAEWLAASQHEGCTREIELAEADGASVAVQLSAAPLETDGLRGVCVVVSDISGRRRAEEARRVEDSRYRHLFDSLTDGFVQVGMDGRIQECNPAYERLVGYSQDELRRMTYIDLTPARWRAAEARIIAEQTLTRGYSDVYQKELRRKDGGIVPVELTTVLLRSEEDDAPVGMCGVVRDNSDRKQAEEALQRVATEAERSNLALQQFAYVASHDLQEPLRMVASYVDLLARRYRGRLDADADDFIAFAVDGATRMQQLINDLLSYSRIATRPEELVPTSCDSVLEHVLANLHAAIETAHAVITHDALPMITVDDVQLGQVLQNLIGNAIKFHGAAPPRVHVSATWDDGAWRFAVRDNGIGIEARQFERIFAIFQRLQSRRAYPGTGMGLAIAKRIIEQHGGRIWVESEPERGSTFFFTIPDQAPATDQSRPVGRA